MILDAAIHASHDILSKILPEYPSALIDIHRVPFIATPPALHRCPGRNSKDNGLVAVHKIGDRESME
jgi:hypothetical protein